MAKVRFAVCRGSWHTTKVSFAVCFESRHTANGSANGYVHLDVFFRHPLPPRHCLHAKSPPRRRSASTLTHAAAPLPHTPGPPHCLQAAGPGARPCPCPVPEPPAPPGHRPVAWPPRPRRVACHWSVPNLRRALACLRSPRPPPSCSSQREKGLA